MKKRSGRPKSSGPPKDIFFVDRSLGRRIVPAALREAGHSVVAHDDQFKQDAPDEEWLAVAGDSGWLVLSADKAIRRTTNEIEAFKRHGVLAVFLTSGNLSGPDLATLFAHNANKIVKTLKSAKPPALFSMTKNGELREIKI